MPLYNRVLAVLYAQKYALNYNQDWPTDFHSDCTNFVSQALLAGGWQMCAGWYATRAEDAGRFCDGKCTLDRSYSWAGAAPFADFLASSGRASRCQEVDLFVGDIIQILDSKGQPDHTMIVTQGAGSNSALSYHTQDRLNNPLKSFAKKQMNGLFYWRLKDIYPEVSEYLRGDYREQMRFKVGLK